MSLSIHLITPDQERIIINDVVMKSHGVARSYNVIAPAYYLEEEPLELIKAIARWIKTRGYIATDGSTSHSSDKNSVMIYGDDDEYERISDILETWTS